jgi:hypothetical protein
MDKSYGLKIFCWEDQLFPRLMNFLMLMMIVVDLNELTYTELILSIDDKTVNRKVTFSLVDGYKSKEYVDNNAFMTLESLKNKFESVSAPSLVKMKKQFRQCAFKSNQDPEIWITEPEDLRIKLKEFDPASRIINS